MVNKCAVCTALSIGLVGIIVYMFLEYGLAAGFYLLAALVCCVVICLHAILKVRHENHKLQWNLKEIEK